LHVLDTEEAEGEQSYHATTEAISTRFTGEKPSARRIRGLSFGDYVHAEEPMNELQRRSTVRPRTNGAIAIRPIMNDSGSWLFIRVDNGEAITRDKWTLLPTPSEVSRLMQLPHDPQRRDFGINVPGVLKAPMEERASEMPETSVPETEPEQTAGHQDKPEDMTDDASVFMPNHSAIPQRSTRIAERTSTTVMHASIERQLEQHGEAERAAVVKEMSQMLRRRVWTPVPADIEPPDRALPSQAFIKVKEDADGRPTETKALLVVGGHKQERGDEDYSSPTVSTEGLMTVLALPAAKRHVIASIDVEAAFLEIDIDRDLYMKIDRTLSTILCEIDPSYNEYKRGDGQTIGKLVKSLYGTVQASQLFVRCPFCTHCMTGRSRTVSSTESGRSSCTNLDQCQLPRRWPQRLCSL
jgi:hypothetical protein